MSQDRQKTYNGDHARSRWTMNLPEQMENIELGEMSSNTVAQIIHPALRELHDHSSRPPGSSTLISDPDSYNPQSSGGDTSWSHRRLLNWLKVSQPSEGRPPSTTPFSRPRELGADEYHLAMTGYDQVFHRFFTKWDNLFAMLATMGLATSVPAIIFTVIIYAGGPGAALMNWIVIGLFSIVLTLCLGEIAASMPTSAGLYFYTYRLGGKDTSPFLSWVTAWLSWIGWLTVVPSSAQLASNFLLSVFKVHWGGSAWVDHAMFHWILTLVTLTIFSLLPNTLSGKAILWVLRVCIATSAVLIVLYLTWFPAKAGSKINSKNLQQSVNYINHDNALYVGDTYAWALAALFPAWIFKGFEVSIHMCEETKKASRSVATGMWAGVVIGYVIGIPVLIVLLSCIEDVHALSTTATMFPQAFTVYLLDLIGHNEAISILVLTWIDAALVTAVLFMSAQRLTFALARDDVVPFSSWIARVSAQKLPVNAAFVVFGYSFLVSMIGVIGTSTFQALLAISVVAQNLSAALVIFARLTYGRRQFAPASWNLGKASVPLNIIALAYTIYIFVILIMPFWFPVRAKNFNFAPVAVIVILLVAIATWYAPRYGRRNNWEGPRVVKRDDVVYAGTPPNQSPKMMPAWKNYHL